jgi:hypothetical protein
MRSDDFKIDHLRPHEQLIAKAVLRVLPRDATGGGCQAFYSPDEWAKRSGEEYGRDSLLVLVHDGGDLAPHCNLDYCNYKAHEKLYKSLRKLGLFVEQCTGWYSAIYRA